MKKSTSLWCEDCRFVCFETGLGKPMLTLNDLNGLKNTTNVYSIHLELRKALPCQISTGKWKYGNPCLDFLGIPDQRTAYVKRQERPRWTYIRRSSVTPDLIMDHSEQKCAHFCSEWCIVGYGTGCIVGFVRLVYWRYGRWILIRCQEGMWDKWKYSA